MIKDKMEEWRHEANNHGPKRLNANWPPNPNGRSNPLSVNLDADEYTKVYLAAVRHGVPMAWVVRRLIRNLDPDTFPGEGE